LGALVDFYRKRGPNPGAAFYQCVGYFAARGSAEETKSTVESIISINRRGGPHRSGYTLTHSYNATLLIDELDLDDASRGTDILRPLRTGTVPGVPAVRCGKTFSTYGVKAVASRQVPRDAALLSKCIVIPMLPRRKETSWREEGALEATDWCGFRLIIASANHTTTCLCCGSLEAAPFFWQESCESS
jgi:hypothetical protein